MFKKEFKKIIGERQLRQKDIAFGLNISQANLTLILNEQRNMPSDFVEKLSKLLNLKEEEINILKKAQLNKRDETEIKIEREKRELKKQLERKTNELIFNVKMGNKDLIDKTMEEIKNIIGEIKKIYVNFISYLSIILLFLSFLFLNHQFYYLFYLFDI